MRTLKEFLQEDFSSKTKAEIVEVIKNIKSVIGSDYNNIVGITEAELPKLKKEELLNVVSMIEENYKSSWDDQAKLAGDIIGSITDHLKADNTFSVSDASNADFAAELGSIEFDKLIGGPLDACVTAQANASLATVNFIKEVGFDRDGKLIMVDFSHTRNSKNPNFGKEDAPAGTNTTDEYIDEDIKLTVPFISTLNIPSLRIENCTIDFHVKLNSVYTRDVSDKLGIDASLGFGWGPIKFNVSASYQRSSSTGIKVEKEYTMGVKVVATNDEMPAGLEKVLGVLAA